MAVPSYSTDLVDITLAESTTGWSAFGGGASGLSASPDLAIQGTNCVDKQVTNADKGMLYGTGAGVTFGSVEHVYIWLFCGTPGLIDTYANNGLYLGIGDSTSAFVKFHMTGSDQFELDETATCWVVRFVNTSNGSAPQRTLVGSPGTTPSDFGGGLNTTASVKGANIGLDALRRGSEVRVFDGDSGTPATWDAFASYANDVSRRWGIVVPTGTGAVVQGRVVWGVSGGNSVYSRDSNRTITFRDVPHALSTLNGLIFGHASNDVVWTNIGVIGLGTTSPGFIEVQNNAPLDWQDSVIQQIGTTTLDSNSTMDGCTWIGCDIVTGAGASLLNTSFVEPNVAADEAALVWDVATDPSGLLNGASFVSHPTTAHHAIEFGTTSPLTMSLADMTFADFNAANGQNDSVLYFRRSSGTVTVNLSGMATPSYKTDGATINFVSVYDFDVVGIEPGSELTIVDALDDGHVLDDGVEVPHSASLDLTGDLEIIACFDMSDWTPSVSNTVIAKGTGIGSNRSYAFGVNASGYLEFEWFNSANTAHVAGGTSGQDVATPLANPTGGPGWVRVRFDADDGVQGSVIDFDYSTDPVGTPIEDVTWTALTQDTVAEIVSRRNIQSSTRQVEIGLSDLSGWNPIAIGSKIHVVRQYDGIGGTVVIDADWREYDMLTDNVGNTLTKVQTAAWVAASVTELFHVESATANETWQHDGTVALVRVLLMKTNRVPFQQLVAVENNDQSFPVSQQDDRVYANP